MKYNWTLAEAAPDAVLQSLSQELGIPAVLAQTLYLRGIETPEAARTFFDADISGVHDPYLMADMDLAVDLVIDAIEGKKKILVYGDYDVDGTSSAALLILFFRQLGYFVDYFIPNRLEDGYGLTIPRMEEASAGGTELLITVDCGITAVEEVRRARELGMQVIVCDHHQAGPTLPPANATLDPKRPDCPYPFKELAGVGVAFKLAQAIMQRLGMKLDDFKGLLELVAIGSAADIVPLHDENRVLVKAGVEELNNTENVGLLSLMRNIGLLGKRLDTGQIIFMLAPRLNAVGRMGDAGRAVELLIARESYQGAQIATVLEKENRQRRTLDERTFREAMQMVEREPESFRKAAVVLASEDWHPGVIGIVASRIVEKYYRPAILISMQNGVGKGSARSISGFDIYDAIESCNDLVMEFGGHKYAAGLSIRSEAVPEFRERICAYAAENLTDELKLKKLKIDAEMDFSEIDDNFLPVLKMIAPFGPKNSRPVFKTSGVKVSGAPSIVGKNHLRFRAQHGGKVFDAIGFNLGDLLPRLTEGEDGFEIAYVVEENFWRGRVSTQLRIRDLR